MSIHSSLRSGTLKGQRNVWTRMERIQALRREGRWENGDSVLALPKVRTRFKVKSKKQLKAEAAQPGEGEATEGTSEAGAAKAAE